MFHFHGISRAFQYTSIKMVISCTCKNLLNNKEIESDAKITVLKGCKKFLVDGIPPQN